MTDRPEKGSDDRQMTESWLSELQNVRALLELLRARILSPSAVVRARPIPSWNVA
jgi:hypothetical protein